MKKIMLLTLAASFFIYCTDKKKTEQPEMMPVEADGGIGDGAPSLDSILKSEKEIQVLDTLKNN